MTDRQDYFFDIAKTGSFTNLLAYADEIRGKPYARDVFTQAATHDPVGFLQSLAHPAVVATGLLENVALLTEIAQKHPVDMLAFANARPGAAFAKARSVAAASPKLIDTMLAEYGASNILAFSGDPSRSLGFKRPLYDALPAAFAIGFAQSVSQPEAHKANALQLAMDINALHDSTPDVRFHSASKLSPELLFDAITLGDAELYPSSFRGLNERFLRALDDTHRSPLGPIFSSPARQKQLGHYLQQCASYKALEPLLSRLSPEQQQNMVTTLIGLIHQDDPYSALVLSEAMVANKNPHLQLLLEQQVHAAFEQAQGAKKDLLGLVMAEYARDHPKCANPTEQAFYDGMKAEARYQVGNWEVLKNAQCVDAQKRHFQGYVFYDDPDGNASFQNFLKTYADPKKYKTIDHESYVEIVSLQGKNTLHLMASKPETNGEGLLDIMGDMKAMHPPAQFQALVHRGHSYHLSETMNMIQGHNVPLLMLGSCGGYREIGATLQGFPQAHIVVTTGTGLRSVNDSLLDKINQRIVDGENIAWKPLWQEMAASAPDKLFTDYVNPSENKALRFLRKYHELSSNHSVMEALVEDVKGFFSKFQMDDKSSATLSPPPQTPHVPMTDSRAMPPRA